MQALRDVADGSPDFVGQNSPLFDRQLLSL